MSSIITLLFNPQAHLTAVRFFFLFVKCPPPHWTGEAHKGWRTCHPTFFRCSQFDLRRNDGASNEFVIEHRANAECINSFAHPIGCRLVSPTLVPRKNWFAHLWWKHSHAFHFLPLMPCTCIQQINTIRGLILSAVLFTRWVGSGCNHCRGT